MPVFVNNLQEKVIVTNKQLDILDTVVMTVLKLEKREDDPEVTVAFVDDMYITDLNFRFRQKSEATDVLSFPMEEDYGEEPMVNGEQENILGDIIISMETAERQAEEYGHTLLRELAYLVTHGMFHLLGFDHANEDERMKMRDREEKVLELLSIAR